jgi:CotH kinase protein/Lamin Tail Domain
MKLHRILFRPLFGVLTAALLLFGQASQVRADVKISECMAVNDSVLQDEDLEYSDWIELYNASGSAVDLTGWHLTDSKSDLVKWTFPATNLPAGDFLIVFASGKDKTATNLHANFSLSSSGEYLALVHPDGTNVEHELRGVPDQFPDISYGIQTHGTNPTLRAGQAGYLISHTPGAANTRLPATHPVYSDDSVAQIELEMSSSTWDWLHWGSPDTTTFRSINVRFRHGDIDITVTNVGIQCRGNTSLTEKPRNFNVAFNAFVPGQRLLGLERLNLNANVHEPSMARPKLVKDLHQAADLPVPYGNHVAVVIADSESSYSFFDAVRNNTQPVDDVLLKQRFDTSRGNLYKCLYKDGTPASLEYLGPTGTSYSAYPETYKLRYNGTGDDSYDDLADFISVITQTSDTDFPNAIMETFDVDAFLKRLALDVLTANWDSYWGNGNNYHLFFDPDSRRWSYIPYDFDNVIGISWDYGNINWATCDIYNWPQLYANAPLVERLMDVPEFNNRYSYYMKEMLDDFYTNSTITPAVFHTRSILTNALPFDSGSITNMKEEDRANYSSENPYWSYDNFFWSYKNAQWDWNDHTKYGSYRDWGVTNFTQVRRDSALSQLGTISNIAPVLSEFKMKPSLPRTNDIIEVSIEAFDDSAVTQVSFIYTFDSGPTQTVEMALQTDGSYETNLPAFGTNGTLQYLVSATDDSGQTSTHPYGGSDYAASVEIESDSLNLIFSEIHYHPVDPTPSEIGAGFLDADDFEYVELHNIGDSPMDLTGFSIRDGITSLLPSVNLTNGEYAVVVADTNAFRSRHTNEDIRILGTFVGKLSNGGETIDLEDPQGGVVLSVKYSDSGSWPGRADGDGSSLEVENLLLDITDSRNWRSSSEYGGTPGTAGTGPDNRIVINEVLSHTDAPLCDSIELFNTTDAAIDISGWALSDATTNYTKYVISNGTVLAAASYIVFNETNHFNTSLGVNSNDFALDGAHGDDVFLMETDVQGEPIRFVDRVEFGATANGESFGRWPNGSGRLVPMSSRTFAASNSGPRVGPLLINEIMYNHSTSNDSLEFVEILNPTALPVNLTRWELDGGVDYTFASNTTLAAGETLTLIPFNPENPSNSIRLATFRSTYGLSTNVPLLGGYSGWLDNGGERLRLLRPDEPPIEEPTFYPMLLEDETGYDDDAPWPLTADAGGASLTRLGTNSWGDAFASWMATDPPTPGSVSAPLSDYQVWVSANGIQDLFSTNPATGVSYAEEYLLETNAAACLQLNGPASDAYLYILLPMLEYGISNRIEISTNIVNSASWRDPAPEELTFISNHTYRVNSPTGIPFFIRTQLIPVQ